LPERIANVPEALPTRKLTLTGFDPAPLFTLKSAV
jgi:hypothetical protein